MRDQMLPPFQRWGIVLLLQTAVLENSCQERSEASSLSPCPGFAEVMAGHLTGLSDTNWPCVMCSRMILLFQGVWNTWHCGTFNLTHPAILWPELSFSKLAAGQRKRIFGLDISLHCITLPHSCVAHCFWEKALDRKLSKCYCISYMQCLEPHSSCLTVAESCKVLQCLAWIMASDPRPKSHPGLQLQPAHRARTIGHNLSVLHECSLKQDENPNSTAREDHTLKYREPNNYLPLTTPLCGLADVQHKLPKHSMKKQQHLPERWKAEMNIPSDNEGKPFSHLSS